MDRFYYQGVDVGRPQNFWWLSPNILVQTEAITPSLDEFPDEFIIIGCSIEVVTEGPYHINRSMLPHRQIHTHYLNMAAIEFQTTRAIIHARLLFV